MEEKNLNTDFQNNFNYVLTNLEKDILKANDLEDKLYLEMSKIKVIESLNYVYQNIKYWKKNYDEKKYEDITNNYKEIEAIISQLELCLADYEELFNMNGISYSLFQIGKSLPNIIRRNDKNGR